MFLLDAGRARRTSYKPAALVTAFALAGVGVTALPAQATTNADGTITVDVLGITDFHGRIVADGQAAGAASLAGALDALRAENPDSIVVSSGDNVGASTFVSAVQDDQPTLDALNLMGLQVSAAGNHEFDKGAADLSGRIVTEADFPYLAANVTGVDGLKKSEIITTDAGVKVGFIGVLTTELPSLVSPDGIAGVTVTDPAQAVATEAQAIGDQVDFIVVLAHDGFESTDAAELTGSSDYAGLVNSLSSVPKVHAVMGGHTHTVYAHRVGETLMATQAGQYGETLSKLSFTWDPTTQTVTAVDAENIDLVVDKAPVYPADEEIATLVQEAQTQASIVGARVIGNAATDLKRSVQPDGEENRGGESTIGNLVADIQLAEAERLGAQVAFMNPGGIRQNIAAGDITYENAAMVQPFANTLMVMDMSGAQIRQALEQQWQPEGTSRPFLKLGVSEGFSYTYDPTAPQGQRIGEITFDGEPLTDDAVLKVVVNSFLAGGGDNFTAFAQGVNRADSGIIDLDAMVNQVDAANQVQAPAQQRAVGVTMPDTLVPGSEATVTVSSLAFAANPELAGDTVILSAGDVELATATLDKTPTQASDETGRATLTFTVPAGLQDGPIVLTLTDGVTTVHVTGMVGENVPQPDPSLVQWFFTDAVEGNPMELVEPVGFGTAEADVLLVGDWDGDGVSTPGYRIGNTYYLANSLTDPKVDVTFAYGRPTDLPMVGDWDGNGTETIAVRRGNENFLRNDHAGGQAQHVFAYGKLTDLPMVGDWDGNGTDTLAVRRGNINYLRNDLGGGQAQYVYAYGQAADVPMVGDWDGNGTDTLAVRRGNENHVRNDLLGGRAQVVTTFGDPADAVIVGSFAADAPDTLGIVTLPVLD